jgi:hypothetical protein
MEKSYAIARLVGPVLAAVGIGMLTNSAAYRTMAGQFLGGLPFIYFSGILALVGGLAILNAHHGWPRDWRSLITAIGWMMSFGGVFRIVAPPYVAFIGTALVAHEYFFMGAGIVLLALGGTLIFKGYAA